MSLNYKAWYYITLHKVTSKFPWSSRGNFLETLQDKHKHKTTSETQSINTNDNVLGGC
jgi:hypothetical protein